MRTFKSVLFGSVASVALFCACNSAQESVLLKSGLNPAHFDTCIAVAYDYDSKTFVSDTKNAKSVKLYTLTNSNGMEVSITNFGGRIVSIMVPNKTGEFVDIACGFDKIENYFPWNYETDFGCSVGRYANRINNGEFIIPETTDTIRLDKNNNGYHSLHGGYTGWQYKVYDVVESTPNTLIIKAVSEDGDNKFPGKVEATVKFELTDDNAIAISYDATTDKPTIINMTNHTYFNLSGDFNNTIEESILQVNADFYTPADSTYMPTGEVRAVEGTVFDFRTPKAIGTDFVKGDAEIIAAGGGYDHNWCLNTKGNQEEIRKRMAELNERRRDKQPLNYPSAGSTFKRPEGYFAGKLIMDAGLRGYQVGGARVSDKHCGFVVNVDNATATDVHNLMEDVIKKVQEEFQVTLEPEVIRLGEF